MNGHVKTKIIIILFGIFFLVPQHAFADSQTLAVSPTNVQLKLDRGKVSQGSFNIINQGTGTYSFNVYATPYSVKGEDYTPDYVPIAGATNISNWFKFSLKNSTASEGQSINVDYTVTVPSDVLDGGYYAVAFGETNNPKAAVGVTINERVGMLFFIQVGDNVVKKGSIASFTSKFLQYPPLTSTIRVMNNGSTYFQANYQYTVKDIFGGTKLSLTAQRVILPQTIRKLDLPWKNSPSLGLFKVSGNVNFLGQDHFTGTKYVLVMSRPIRIVSIIVTAVLVILFIVTTFISKKNKRRNKYSKRK